MRTTTRGPCPQCDRGPKDDALAITRDERGTVMFCHRCGYTGATNAPARLRTSIRIEPPRAVGLSDYARDLWSSASLIAGEARAYLEARAAVIPPPEGDLRWHPSLRHPTGFSGPALVAMVRNAVTGAPMTMHRTWINSDGTKRGDPPRMLLRAHPKAGGVVMLWPSEAVTHGLAIAEGIETALSVAHAYTPVWAAIDAANVRNFPVLDGIESLVIAADADDAGLKAAAACAERWGTAGRDVLLATPSKAGCDMNDEVRA